MLMGAPLPLSLLHSMPTLDMSSMEAIWKYAPEKFLIGSIFKNAASVIVWVLRIARGKKKQQWIVELFLFFHSFACHIIVLAS
jgi:hypothetical protein